MTQFVSLSSGSNGNCYYIGNETCGILIDAGIGTRTIKKRLAEVGLSVDRIRCVLVSHDHFDHIRSLGTFAERFCKPVYATAPCITAFGRHYCTRGYLEAGRCRELVPGEWLVIEEEKSVFDGCSEEATAAATATTAAATTRAISVLPFRVPHDATDTVGFYIDFYGETFTFLTDLGAVTEEAVFHAAHSRHLIVEANYDPEMLRTGGYPADLQDRIRGGHGHLSNAQTAELVSSALDISGPLLQDVFLCHLSENNNTPELALATVSEVLSQAAFSTGDASGSPIRLVALPRREPSELFTWD